MSIKQKQQKIVDLAYKQIGKPYKYGSKVVNQPRSFDCSSLAQWLYKKVGINIPRRSLEQAACGKSVRRQNKFLKPGDLLFFTGEYGHYNPTYPEGIGHVAIYVGHKKAIQARGIKGQGRVIMVSVSRLLKRRDLVTIKRILI